MNSRATSCVVMTCGTSVAVYTGVLRFIKASEQRNRQNRADARQRNQTEAVIRRVLITANRRHAYAHRHDERHRNRPRRHAARVIGNAQKNP